MGTLVKEGNEVLADLSHPGDEFIAALGGAGGKGNRFFLANSNRAPTICIPPDSRVRSGSSSWSSKRWHTLGWWVSPEAPAGGWWGTCQEGSGRAAHFLPSEPVGFVRSPAVPRPRFPTQDPRPWPSPLSSRSDSPTQGNPRFSGPFPTQGPLWPPTHSPP